MFGWTPEQTKNDSGNVSNANCRGKIRHHNGCQTLFVPDGVVHAPRNTGTLPAAELATYVLVKGKPLTEFTK